MSAPVVEVRDLRRTFAGGFEAVRGVSFDVAPGELFALLGTNGAGKTSTMEVLEGLAPATSGTVRVLGHDPYRERRAVRPRTGVVLQEGGFPRDLTVLEAARTWAGTLTAPRPPEEVVELVGLADKADVRIRQLSGGQRRRLDLGVAVMGRPDVLFLDEPTTGLDPESRRTTWEVVRSMVADGMAVVLTTHYLEEAEQLADHLAIMAAGEVVVAGTPEEVVAAEPSRVRWRPAPGTAAADLPVLVEPDGRPVDVRLEDGRAVVRTRALRPVLVRLLAWADEHGDDLEGLAVTSASLEQVFLAAADRDRDGATAPVATGSPDRHDHRDLLETSR
ncbi:ABC transporter ATP-binding protein [Pseudokineococcus lusitanus]|uniref:ABC-2 type transport system ATP-binding protein n=1 Tax=Pseudokineococcus lusitanus TaxID=763993 RepID=A0A3N1HRC0_9ACTN|nr:ABC transporter ATP-binding protein [Pseudokineococcus lusitanus]ROP45055.1 ABC-2 type transport system ATP-binding protein [Pseudokineococcus lusitanus]